MSTLTSKKTKKKQRTKIDKYQLIKMLKKANRELEIEQGSKGPRGGYHITDKDRPRKRIRREDYDN